MVLIMMFSGFKEIFIYMLLIYLTRQRRVMFCLNHKGRWHICWRHIVVLSQINNYREKTGGNVLYQQKWCYMLKMMHTICCTLHIVFLQSSSKKIQVAFENYQKLRVQLDVYGILPKEVYIPHPKVPNFFFST
nr:protein RRP6-like 3 [Ipomoea batatas]